MNGPMAQMDIGNPFIFIEKNPYGLQIGFHLAHKVIWGHVGIAIIIHSTLHIQLSMWFHGQHLLAILSELHQQAAQEGRVVEPGECRPEQGSHRPDLRPDLYGAQQRR